MTFRSLQLLRCMACGFVVFAHLYPERLIGIFSVDIFFLISAFFMAMLITTPSKTGVKFALERVARIIPTYWVLTFGVFLMALLTPGLVETTTVNYGNLIKSLLFIPYYKENGMLNPVLAVGWTVNYEMMFYLFCTTSFFFSLRWRIPVAVLQMLLLYLLANLMSDTTAFAHFYSAYYLLELSAGMLLWQLYTTWKSRINASPLLAWALIVIPLIFAVLANWYVSAQVSWLLIFGLPAIAMVCGALLYEPYIKGDSLLIRLAIRVGDASYSIYLTHMFIIEGMRKLAPKVVAGLNAAQPVIMVLTFLLCLVVGLLVDHYFDKPSVKYLRSLLLRKLSQPKAVAS